MINSNFLGIYGSAAIILQGQPQNVLLTLRNCDPNRNLWELPGGSKEQNESDEEAVKREVMEEIGIEIEVKEQFMVVQTPRIYVIYFICAPLSLHFKLQTEEVRDCRFFSLDSLPPNMVPLHRGVLEEMKQWKK